MTLKTFSEVPVILCQSFCYSFLSVTSRPPRPGEVNNRDYQFVSREELEEEAANGTLVEHGEFKGHLYGTSSITLKSMINAGYVVIVTPHYQVSGYYALSRKRKGLNFIISDIIFMYFVSLRHCIFCFYWFICFIYLFFSMWITAIKCNVIIKHLFDFLKFRTFSI